MNKPTNKPGLRRCRALHFYSSFKPISMKRVFLFLLVAMLCPAEWLYAQSSFTAPDTVAINDTITFTLDYQGSHPAPLFKWVITDGSHGYDSVVTSSTGRRGYEFTTDLTYRHVFENPGVYVITVETPEERLQKELVAWTPTNRCPSSYDECTAGILNGSFEDFLDIPNCEGQVDKICNWNMARVYDLLAGPGVISMHKGSPDFWHRGYDASLSSPYYCPNKYKIPYGSHAVQAPRVWTDNAFIGFYTWSKLMDFTEVEYPNPVVAHMGEYREYFQQYLEEPLLPGNTYTISFWVNLAEISNLRTDFHIGFTTKLPKSYMTLTSSNPNGSYRLEPITAAEGTLLTCTPTVGYNDWEQHTITFTYTGVEPAYYMTIGNWKDDANCNPQHGALPLIPPYPSPQYDWYVRCYYLIDDIQMVQENNVCCDVDLVIDGRGGFGRISDYTISPGMRILVEGNLDIDQNTTFTNCDIRMGAGARINVNDGKQMRLENSILHACDKMWDGIYADNPATQIVFVNSEMWDAIEGLYLTNGVQVTASGSTFKNNYHSIQLFNHNGTWPLTLTSTQFTSSGLLPPHWGRRSFKHISATNAGTINISPPIGSANTFLAAVYGIYTDKTHVTVNNNGFQFINDYNGNGYSSAICIRHTEGGNTPRNINIGTTQKNTFSNSVNGIRLQGALNAYVNKNTFTNIGSTGIYGVNTYRGIFTSDPPTIIIKENTLTNVKYGVDMYNLFKAEVLIQENDIYNPTINPLSIGIRLRNIALTDTVRCNTNTDGYLVRIIGNSVENHGKSIRNEYINCLLVDENIINMRRTPGAQFCGIGTFECPRAYIQNNTVSGDIANWQMIGIRQGNSAGVRTRCNTVTMCGPALMFEGQVSNPSLVYNNDLYDSETGVYLNFGEIGGQVGGNAQLNRWHGSFTNHFYGYFSDGTYSPFYFAGTAGTPTWPSTIFANSFPVLLPVVPTINGTYNSLWTICGNLSDAQQRADSVLLLETVSGIVNETTIPTAYMDEVSSLRKLFVYRTALENDWLLSDPDISTFVTSMVGSNYDWIYRASKKIGNGNYAEAKAELDNLVSPDPVEQVLKDGLIMYITEQTTAEGIHHVDELPKVADLLSLKEIAKECYFKYNSGTLTARTALDVLLGWEFGGECEYNAPRNEPAPSPDPELLVYPNPAGNSVTIDLLYVPEGQYNLALRDVTGKTVFSSYIYSGTTQVALPTLSDGIYIYTITDRENVLFNGKIFIKQ